VADIGRTIGGRYKLVEALGEDEISTVFRAHDLEHKTETLRVLIQGRRSRLRDELRLELGQPRAGSPGHRPCTTRRCQGVYLISSTSGARTWAGSAPQRPVPARRAASVTPIVADAVAAAHEQGWSMGSAADKIVVTRRAEIRVSTSVWHALWPMPIPPVGTRRRCASVPATPRPARHRCFDIFPGRRCLERWPGGTPWTAGEIARPEEPPASVGFAAASRRVEAICRKAMAPGHRRLSAALMADALHDTIALSARHAAVRNPKPRTWRIGRLPNRPSGTAGPLAHGASPGGTGHASRQPGACLRADDYAAAPAPVEDSTRSGMRADAAMSGRVGWTPPRAASTPVEYEARRAARTSRSASGPGWRLLALFRGDPHRPDLLPAHQQGPLRGRVYARSRETA
jgi:hypothetical protein